jgi:hypothetical protein
MIKIKATYSSLEEKQKLIKELSKGFDVVKVSKDYPRGNKSLNDIYVDINAK